LFGNASAGAKVLAKILSQKWCSLDMYRGVMPFIGLQLLLLMMAIWPDIAVWLPEKLLG